MSPACLRIGFPLLALVSLLGAQQAPAELPAVQKTRLLALLKRLDMDHTDWVLLQDVGEKVKALGAPAIPIVAKAAEAAETGGEGRYRIRLLGVLARIDPERGVAKLKDVISAQNVNLAAIAARVLGRSGAPVDRIAAVVQARLPEEKRAGVVGALALAAGDAGATATGKLLKERLTSGKLDSGARPWFSIALAQVAGPDLQAEVVTWLQEDSPLIRAGVLLTRRARTPKIEAALLALYAATSEETLSDWLPPTLGVCGGDLTREAFRKALDEVAKEQADAGITVVSDPDPRLLALVRLGEAKAVAWSKAAVMAHGEVTAPGGRTISGMSPLIARLPELLGKWNVDGATDVLVACANSKAPCWPRAYAARGLCWRRDARGIEAAAAILCEKEHGEHEFGVVEGLQAAQQTLHEFTANTDRPDYLAIERGEEAKAVAIGEEWRKWLQKLGGKTLWREPAQDANELLFWY